MVLKEISKETDDKPYNPDRLNIWMAAREYEGICGVGGVKDVCRYLSENLSRNGHDVNVFIPRYGFISPEDMGFNAMSLRFNIDMNYAYEERREEAGFWHKEVNGVNIILIESGRFSEKNGIYAYTHLDAQKNPSVQKGTGHIDYFAMNVLLQKAMLLYGISNRLSPDIIHCHDGHTAILPAIMRENEGLRHFFNRTSCLVTIHNAGMGYHQEVRDLPFAKAITHLPWRVINSSLLNGAFDPFLACSPYASINTVSENYAKELQHTELDRITGGLGHALKERGVLLTGITNGIEPSAYRASLLSRFGVRSPIDPLLGNIMGKVEAKSYLYSTMDEPFLRDIDRPLLTFIGRLTRQKGIDCLCDALEMLAQSELDFRIIMLGTGEESLEWRLNSLAQKDILKGRMKVILGYNEDMAQLIYAAGDFFIIPSYYEPCGLTDLIAQLYGNIPVVRLTGGLVKVKDGYNGIGYKEHSKTALFNAIIKALNLYNKDKNAVISMQKNAIREIYEKYTWDKVANRYEGLYYDIIQSES